MTAAIHSFHHNGFKSSAQPVDIDEQLAKMIDVEFKITGTDRDMHCHSQLFGKGYSVEH
jgi:hypothetical protein